jgi:hypothetical protein
MVADALRKSYADWWYEVNKLTHVLTQSEEFKSSEDLGDFAEAIGTLMTFGPNPRMWGDDRKWGEEKAKVGAGPANMEHVLQLTDCTDPELHHPDVIETEDQRLTAQAWQLVGAWKGIELVEEGIKAGFDVQQSIAAAYAEAKDDPAF